MTGNGRALKHSDFSRRLIITMLKYYNNLIFYNTRGQSARACVGSLSTPRIVRTLPFKTNTRRERLPCTSLSKPPFNGIHEKWEDCLELGPLFAFFCLYIWYFHVKQSWNLFNSTFLILRPRPNSTCFKNMDIISQIWSEAASLGEKRNHEHSSSAITYQVYTFPRDSGQRKHDQAPTASR